MARRTPVAVARVQALRPALRLRLPVVSARRTWIAAGALVVGLGLAYVVARETPLFALRSVAVSGAPGSVDAEVRAALRAEEGTSLVKLDAAALERRLAELPAVVGARVDRAFPHQLTVVVQPERPVAVVKTDGQAWIVSARAVVIGPGERSASEDLPRVRVADSVGLAPGRTVTDASAAAVLRALSLVPGDFPGRIARARMDDQTVVLRLRSGGEIRLGTEGRTAAKLAAAGAVLGSLQPEERRALAYLDVALPERPVAAFNSQVEG